jgi:ElaB/YqjD/DUF883 family membrane-anchored ribosome-binding protein
MKLFARSRQAMARQALKQAKTGVRDVLGRIADAGDQAVQGLAATGTRLLDAEWRMVEAGRGYVRDNPLKASAITLALGAMAAGLFMAGRRR